MLRYRTDRVLLESAHRVLVPIASEIPQRIWPVQAYDMKEGIEMVAYILILKNRYFDTPGRFGVPILSVKRGME